MEAKSLLREHFREDIALQLEILIKGEVPPKQERAAKKVLEKYITTDQIIALLMNKSGKTPLQLADQATKRMNGEKYYELATNLARQSAKEKRVARMSR